MPDAQSVLASERIAQQVRGLDARCEAEAIAWIEDVSEFDERAPG